MIFRGPFPDVPIPDMPLTPFVLRHADRLADKPALIDGPSGRTLSYGQLARAIRRAAAGLHARGFRQGDVFAIYAPNTPEYAVAFHAVASLGGITTTANPLYTVDELTFQLNDSGAAYLLTVSALMDKASAAARRAGVRELVVFGEAPGAAPFASLLAVAVEAPAVAIDPREDVVLLLYSSGTTGLPKGVMLTHRNLVANAVQFATIGTFGEDDVMLGVLPYFHVFGLQVVMQTGLAVGATIVTLPRFELEPFLQTLQAYGVTHAGLAPPVVLALAEHPAVERYDLSRLARISSGGAPLNAAVAAACEARVGCVVEQGLGMTEAGPLTRNPPGRNKPGTIGPCLPNTEARVVNPVNGAALGAGETGELWSRGPQVMKGYLNRPDATAQTIDADGWLRTGDLAFADADGYFTVVDRLKELIKYKGLQVAPAELEAVLLAHPAVADAAVIPSPDKEAGEVPKAFVVLKGEATAEELLSFVAARVAPYKKVRRLEFADQLPKSPSGKVLRRVLVERERAALLSPV